MTSLPPVITPSEPGSARRSRPQKLADAIKDWVMDQRLSPGDRLPGEAEMMDRFGMAKGTVREAMRILEAQGLVRTRTGPGGGAFLHQVSRERAQALLGNYFFFNELTLGDIYEVRLLLEPEVAASLAGKLSEDQLAELDAIIATYVEPAQTAAQERDQHIASLSFHARLAEWADNQLLGFVVGFMAKVLADLTVYQKLYEPPNHRLWSQGKESQQRLIRALGDGDPQLAREIMKAHMGSAWDLMRAQEARVVQRFIG